MQRPGSFCVLPEAGRTATDSREEGAEQICGKRRPAGWYQWKRTTAAVDFQGNTVWTEVGSSGETGRSGTHVHAGCILQNLSETEAGSCGSF